MKIISPEIQIESVVNPSASKEFIRLPWVVNRDDPNWVPPLIMSQKQIFDLKNHPFWKGNEAAFFLARKNGKAVGRLGVFLSHQHENYHKIQTGFFGFLEGVNDKDIFEKLLLKAEEWLKEKGCVKIIGPMNPSINYELGFLVTGFDSPPYFMLTHNPSYYHKLMQLAGYEKAKDFYSYYVSKENFQKNERIKKIQRAVQQRYPVTIRTPDMKRFTKELEIINDIYNDSFADHWGFVPMDKEEFTYLANDLKSIINPEIVLIAEYKGQAVGFLLCLPNYNEVFIKIKDGKLFPFGIFKLLHWRKRIKNVRVITVGIKHQYQHLGLGSLFYLEITKSIFQQGFEGGEMSWVAEDNSMMRKTIELLGGKIYKTFRVYQKSI